MIWRLPVAILFLLALPGAWADGLKLDPAAPGEQRLYNEDARSAFDSLKTFGGDPKRSQPNVNEFYRLIQDLEGRGYVALKKSYVGVVKTPAQFLFVTKEQGGGFRFRFRQSFLKRGVLPERSEIYPEVFIEGVYHGGDEPLVIIYHSGVRWDYLPSDKGGNSSAGGVVD